MWRFWDIFVDFLWQQKNSYDTIKYYFPDNNKKLISFLFCFSLYSKIELENRNCETLRSTIYTTLSSEQPKHHPQRNKIMTRSLFIIINLEHFSQIFLGVCFFFFFFFFCLFCEYISVTIEMGKHFNKHTNK